MSVFVARLEERLYDIPVREVAEGCSGLLPALEVNVAWVWKVARSSREIGCQPPLRLVERMRGLLSWDNWGIDCFIMQPWVELGWTAVGLFGLIYDGSFGWLGRLHLWRGECSAYDAIRALSDCLARDCGVLYGPEGCDGAWDYALATNGWAEGWLGRVP
jgi:hypothetical protein